jgi:hypothetical protein
MLIKHKCNIDCGNDGQPCSICKLKKSFKNYHVDSSRPNGHSPRCKECTKDLGVDYYEKNKEKLKQSSTKRIQFTRNKNQTHDCEINKCDLNTRNCNECLNEFSLILFDIHKDCGNSHHSICKICRYKKGASRRKLEWELTNEQSLLLMTSPCYYCDTRSAYKVNGLDRVINTKHYEWSNVVPCCGSCNRSKGRLTLSNFLKEALQMAERSNRIVALYKEGKFDAWLLDK